MAKAARIERRGPAERLAARVMAANGWRRMLLAIAAGAVCTLALAPFDFPAAGFVGFPILVWLLDGAVARPGRGRFARALPAFWVGWGFGFGYFLAGLWWLGAALLVDASEFAVFLPLAVLGLPAGLAILHGLAAVAARALWPDSAWRIFALAGALGLAEYVRGFLFTGFPWNEIGAMAASAPLLMQTTSLIGLTGLTVVAIVVYAAPAALADLTGRGPVLVIALGLLVLHLGFGAARLALNATVLDPDVAVKVVQPNIQQALKWDDAEAREIFARHLRLTREALAARGDTGTEPAATLVVWPETAFPFIVAERPDALQAIADTLAPGQTLVAGGARLERSQTVPTRAYNAVIAFGDDGAILDAADKVHLVPFGEYLPFRSFLRDTLGLSQVAEMPGGFTAGTERRAIALPGLPAFLPLICYEIVFDDEIDAAGADRPAFLLNVTNDAWYGRTPGPYQHLRMSELSAVSLGLPLVRSANTGISVVTDAFGREIAGLSLGSTGVVEASLPRAAPATIFARIGVAPFAILVLLCLAVAAVACRAERSRR